MTLTQLKYIIAVDDNRHFATAAERCYVTQPTLSMQIHKFEQELNILIFDRSKHPVIPTQKGELIIEQARLILKESDRLRNIIAAGKDEFNGTFRIGVIPSLAPYLLPFFIKQFTQQYPNLKIEVEESLTNNIIEKLHHDQLDVGIIAKQVQQKNIYQISLFREPFVVFVSSNHSIAKSDSIDIQQLKDENVWLLRDGNYLRDQIIDLCKKADIKINHHAIQIKSDNLETLKNLVENNMGLTLLPFLAARNIDPSRKIVIRPFKAPVPERSIQLVYSRLYLKKKVITAFQHAITSNIPSDLMTAENGILIA